MRRSAIKDPVAEYNNNYAGMTRAALKKKAPALYTQLWRHGFLDCVPTVESLKAEQEKTRRQIEELL